jgi:hypothetical protein
VAERLSELFLTAPPETATQAAAARALSGRLAAATRTYVSSWYAPEQIAELMGTLLLLGEAPTENWMFAAELACVPPLQRACQRLEAHSAADNSSRRAGAAAAEEEEEEDVEQEALLLAKVGTFSSCRSRLQEDASCVFAPTNSL